MKTEKNRRTRFTYNKFKSGPNAAVGRFCLKNTMEGLS